VDGAQIGGRARRVAERGPNLGDEIREVGFGDERVRPQPLLQDSLRERVRPLGGERREQFESLGR
jgi:hypothetical protein